MIRILVIAEGKSEAEFITRILSPHLEERQPGRVGVSAIRLSGHYTFPRIRNDVRRCLRTPDPHVAVTTMIDLYKIAGDFPGLKGFMDDMPPRQRVLDLEQRFAESIDDRRFRPYIQLHEFEALVLTDLTALAEQHPKQQKELEELGARLSKQFATPEDVNRITPPSYRILQVVPEYNKVLDGVAALTRIAHPALRARCPHFGEWCDFLETVG